MLDCRDTRSTPPSNPTWLPKIFAGRNFCVIYFRGWRFANVNLCFWPVIFLPKSAKINSSKISSRKNFFPRKFITDHILVKNLSLVKNISYTLGCLIHVPPTPFINFRKIIWPSVRPYKIIYLFSYRGVGKKSRNRWWNFLQTPSKHPPTLFFHMLQKISMKLTPHNPIYFFNLQFFAPYMVKIGGANMVLIGWYPPYFLHTFLHNTVILWDIITDAYFFQFTSGFLTNTFI